MILKPQDILISLKILVKTQQGLEWSYSQVAGELCMSPSEVYSGVKRVTEARLIERNRMPVKRALEEFLIHGIKYSFPVTFGGATKGIPTSYAASPLNSLISFSSQFAPVWPHPEGVIQGMELKPLYKSVPETVPPVLIYADLLASGDTRNIETAEKIYNEYVVKIIE